MKIKYGSWKGMFHENKNWRPLKRSNSNDSNLPLKLQDKIWYILSQNTFTWSDLRHKVNTTTLTTITRLPTFLPHYHLPQSPWVSWLACKFSSISAPAIFPDSQEWHLCREFPGKQLRMPINELPLWNIPRWELWLCSLLGRGFQWKSFARHLTDYFLSIYSASQIGPFYRRPGPFSQESFASTCTLCKYECSLHMCRLCKYECTVSDIKIHTACGNKYIHTVP